MNEYVKEQLLMIEHLSFIQKMDNETKNQLLAMISLEISSAWQAGYKANKIGQL